MATYDNFNWQNVREGILGNSDLIAIRDNETAPLVKVRLYMYDENGDNDLLDVTDMMRLNNWEYDNIGDAKSVRESVWNDNPVIEENGVPLELSFAGFYWNTDIPAVRTIAAENDPDGDYYAGEPWGDITSNIAFKPSKGCVFLDGHDYSQPAINAAIDAGLISKTGFDAPSGYLMFEEARISPFITGVFPEPHYESLDLLSKSDTHDILFWVTSDNLFVKGQPEQVKEAEVQHQADYSDEVIDTPISLDFDPELSTHDIENVNGVVVDHTVDSRQSFTSRFITAADNPEVFDITRDSVTVYGLRAYSKGDHVDVMLPALSEKGNNIKLHVPLSKDYLDSFNDMVYSGQREEISFNVGETFAGWGKFGSNSYVKTFDTNDLLDWGSKGRILAIPVEGLDVEKDTDMVLTAEADTWEQLGQFMGSDTVDFAKQVSGMIDSAQDLDELKAMYNGALKARIEDVSGQLLDDGDSVDTSNQHGDFGE